MKQVPGYNRVNLAQQAERRYLRDGKTEAQRAEENREAVAEVLVYCILGSLNDLYGIGEARLQRVAGEAGRTAEQFETAKKAVGWVKAKRMLENETVGVLPDGFQLPAIKSIRKQRERVMFGEQREAAEIIMRFYALAMHKVLDFGAERVAAVAAATADYYRQFGGYAKDGDYYAYVKLAQRMGRILHAEMQVVESGAAGPVFGDKAD